MKPVEKQVDIYTTRSGRECDYTFTFKKNSLTVTDHLMRTAKATWDDANQNPEWTHELENLLSREYLKCSGTQVVELETIWDKLRNGEITPEKLEHDLVSWANSIVPIS